MWRYFLTGVLFLVGGVPGSLIAARAGAPRRPNDNPPHYSAFQKPLPASAAAVHAVSRLTFGARPADLEHFRALGRKRWIDEQLHPDRLPENRQLQTRLQPFSSLRMSSPETVLNYPPPKAVKDQDDDVPPERKTFLTNLLTTDQIRLLKTGTAAEKSSILSSLPPSRDGELVWALPPSQRRALFPVAPVELRRQLIQSVNPPRVVAEDLTEAKLLRAVYSNRQLAEILDDFWYNHFNVFLNKGADRYYVVSYERDVIRPHILDKFYDLLLATAQSPAMLFYLDNWQSVGPDSEAARRGRKRGLNENYGRELLELHTLGVDGGYTQQDVINVARCFTGWTITKPREGGGFEYNDKWHDEGQKVVLGHIIKAGGGMNDGLQVLAILARQPATAHFISWKLAQRFVADDPPPSLVNRMAAAFLRKDGDLRDVVRTMLLSPEFWSQGACRAKVKTPFELVASSLRVMDADVVSGFSVSNELTKLGEPLYRKVEPGGYSSANTEWVSSASLLERMNLALAFTHNRIPGVRIDLARWSAGEPDPVRLAAGVLGRAPDPDTAAALASANDIPTALGLILGSPDFQRH